MILDALGPLERASLTIHRRHSVGNVSGQLSEAGDDLAGIDERAAAVCAAAERGAGGAREVKDLGRACAGGSTTTTPGPLARGGEEARAVGVGGTTTPADTDGMVADLIAELAVAGGAPEVENKNETSEANSVAAATEVEAADRAEDGGRRAEEGEDDADGVVAEVGRRRSKSKMRRPNPIWWRPRWKCSSLRRLKPAAERSYRRVLRGLSQFRRGLCSSRHGR
jgi:hypothetical protein